MKTNLKMTAPCLFGLESVLKFELQKIGAEEISADNGRVSFVGDESILARANINLRTAERVSIVLGSFSASSFTELFDGVEKLPFEDYIGEFSAFPVKGWSLESQLTSIPSCQSIIKKSVVKRLSSVYKRDIFPETGAIHQITFSIHKDTVTMMLDSSGTSLHKRGYRELSGEAPIRETLAAAICDLARTRDNSVVYDPFCGSGTLLIEAAQRACNIAPGIDRGFAAEKWEISDSKIWKQEREVARKNINKDVPFIAYGSDIDEKIIRTAQANARIAGVEDKIKFSTADIVSFLPKSPSVTITNPPYGERLMKDDDVNKIFAIMGKVMPKLKENSYYIIGPTDDFEAAFGRKADKRRKLYNGMLPCQLYMYFR